MAEIKFESLGKYRIIDEIGSGRFSIVYRAEHPFLKKTVAVKLMLPALFNDQEVNTRFIEAVRTAAALKHENIAKIIDLANEQNHLIMVMDFISGGSLQQRIQDQGRMSFHQIRRIISQVAAALDHAHGQGIIHGDVKPGNILLSEDGTLKLGDFGVLQAVRISGAANSAVAGGSPEYISPEQVNGAEPDARSDQYALGVIAYELFTGQVPFAGETALAISLKKMNETPAAASQVNPLISPKLDAVLQQALEKDPDKRFADCGAFARAIIAAESSTETEQYNEIISRASAALASGDADSALPLIEYAMQIMPDEPAARELLEDLQLREDAQHSYLDAGAALGSARAGAQKVLAELDSPADPQGIFSQLVPAPAPGWITFLQRWSLALMIALGLTVLGLFVGLAGALFASVAPADNLQKATLVAIARTSTPVPPTNTPQPTLPPSATPEPTLTITPTAEPSATLVPTLGAGSVETRGSDAMLMVFVPAGPFTMGSDNKPDEQPVHTVTLDAFWIDQTEVTNQMYERCVQQGGCVTKNRTTSFSRSRYYTDPQFADFPVVQVDWNQANAYCKWAGARLPTEAEWEKAARGTDGRTYPWGEGIDTTFANYARAVIDTSRVGSYESGKSPYGVYDLSGNVWEWVSSLYRPYPYNADDGREDLSVNLSRVLRGGSWYDNAQSLRASFRDKLMASNQGDKIGFRCARNANP